MSSVRIPQDARTEGAFSLRPVRDHTVTTIGALTHELHERCQVGGSSTCVWNDVIASLRRCAHCGTRSIAGRVGYPVPLQGLNGGYETSRPNVQQALNRMRSPAPSRNVRIDKCSGACGKSVPMLWPAAAVASRSGPLAASAAGREAGNITSYTFRIAAEKTGVCGSPRACYQCDRSMTGGPTWRKPHTGRTRLFDLASRSRRRAPARAHQGVGCFERGTTPQKATCSNQKRLVAIEGHLQSGPVLSTFDPRPLQASHLLCSKYIDVRFASSELHA